MEQNPHKTSELILPIDNYLPDMAKAVLKSPVTLIQAQPGAGKTTRLPAYLLRNSSVLEKLAGKKIVVLEPRRLAAISASDRVASEQGWELGQQIGYQVRFEQKLTAQTQLIFMTEGLLLRRLEEDPNLSEVGMIIMDEFHERSINTDILFVLIRELQQLERTDLKLIIMSATLDAEALAKKCEAPPVFDIPGIAFELKINFEKQGQRLSTDHRFIEEFAQKIISVMAQTTGEMDALCFLPGVSEIERVSQFLEGKSSLGFNVSKLHGQQSLEEQKKTLYQRSGRTVILCTNIAESSLTVPNVNIVIDSGLARSPFLNPKSIFQILKTHRISKASAKQRAGRAARLKNGFAFRMWSTHDEVAMPDFDQPEILRSSLSDLTLTCLNQRADPKSLDWLTPPSPAQWKLAFQDLKSYSALDNEKSLELTAWGKSLSQWPLSLTGSYLLNLGLSLGLTEEAIQIVCAMERRAPQRGTLSLEEHLLLVQKHPEFKKNAKSAERSSQENKAVEVAKAYFKMA